MRKLSHAALTRKPETAQDAIRASYRAEREGIEEAARAIARRMVSEAGFLRYRASHPSLTYGTGYSWGGSITIAQDAEISKNNAIKILTLYRCGVRLTSAERFAEFVANEVRWAKEDAARAA